MKLSVNEAKLIPQIASLSEANHKWREHHARIK